jgi:hypothetical protein
MGYTHPTEKGVKLLILAETHGISQRLQIYDEEGKSKQIYCNHR